MKTYNLELMPDFLRNLLNVYRSILVVSHLDTLKYASDIRVSINRVDKISQLQFGQNIIYPFKTRGRKPRNTNSTITQPTSAPAFTDTNTSDNVVDAQDQIAIVDDIVDGNDNNFSSVNPNNDIIDITLDEPDPIRLAPENVKV